jgi:hypothetical protein
VTFAPPTPGCASPSSAATACAALRSLRTAPWAAVDSGCGLSRELLRRGARQDAKISQLTGRVPTGKAHVAAEPETGLITECVLTAANVADGPTGIALLASEQPGLEVLGDSAYGGGATRAALRAAGHSQTIKPLPLASAVPGGFTIHDFRIDRHAAMVRCPAGYTAPITSSGRASFTSHCPCCPLRRRCTTAKQGRTICLHPHENELRVARRAVTRSFQQRYRRWRPMVERSIAWLVADGCRRAPYRGIDRNDLWWSVRVAAVNLRRLLALGLTRQDQSWVLA